MKFAGKSSIFRETRRKAASAALLFAFVLTSVAPLMAQPNLKPAADNLKSDSITRAARNKANSLYRVTLDAPDALAKLPKTATVIEDYGSFAVVAAKDLSTNLETARIETEISLPGARFEPLTDNLHRADGFSGADGEPNYFIVQFVATASDKWLDDIRSAGAEIVQYVSHQGYLVYAAPAAMQKISSHSRIRWTGRYLPEDKISPILEAQLNHARSGGSLNANLTPIEFAVGGSGVFDVAVFSRADFDSAQSQITNIGGKIVRASRLPNNYFNTVQIELPLDRLDEAAKLRDVYSIDAHITPRIEDERAAQIIAGNYTSTTALLPPGYNPLTQFGVNGSNVTVAVSDDGVSTPGTGGFYLTAANVVDALDGSTTGASGGHGHINASIIAGSTPFGGLDTLGYNYSLGVAPSSNIINIPFLKAGFAGGDVSAANLAVTTLGPNGVRGTISNNSWGNGTNANAYDTLAAQYDGYARDASTAGTIDPLLWVFSAGNSGTSGLTRPKMSKNTIAVANSENLRTEISSAANNIDDISSSSSRGPAADTRIKPDITAPGTIITGSRAGSGGSVSGQVDANHSYSSGTSHAAPQVAGAAALFTQFWKNTRSGQQPSSAVIKAALINSTVEINGVGSTATIPNGAEGWGRLNMKGMLNTSFPIQYVNETTVFSDTGNNSALSYTVADTTKPVRVTLVWTDPPGTVDPALVNNLDLTVTVGGNSYKGNVFTNGVSTTGGAADIRNNVENVFLPAGTIGTVSILISATAINGDGVLGNADPTDQHFALVVSNVTTGGNPPTSADRADFDGDGKSDVSVFRPSNGAWYRLNSSNGQFGAIQFGTNGDQLATADFDGDLKADFGVFRNGTWYLQRSTAGFASIGFGTTGDIPVPADFDGDNKADVAVFRPSNGSWYYLRSVDGVFVSTQFGANGDKPIQGDFDGDSRADVCVFRPSNGAWYRLNSSNGQFNAVQFGANGDKPAAADFDGDNKADVMVFRPSNGVWYRLNSSNGAFVSVQFGANGDMPSPGDFDGDNKADIAVFRPAGGNWYILNSTNGAVQATQFGTNGDISVPMPIAAN